MTQTLEKDIAIATTPLRDEAPTVPVPRVALEHPLVRSEPEYLRLVVKHRSRRPVTCNAAHVSSMIPA